MNTPKACCPSGLVTATVAGPETPIGVMIEMLVRLLYRGGATYTHIARPLVRMRMGGISTRGLRERWLLNREIVRACRANGIWTSLLIVLLKLPLKALDLLRGRSMRRLDAK